MIKEYLSPRHTRTDSDAYFVRSDVERLVGHTSTRSDTEGWRSAEQVKRVIPFDRIEASEFGIIASRLDDSKEFGAGIIKVSRLSPSKWSDVRTDRWLGSLRPCLPAYQPKSLRAAHPIALGL